MARARALNPGRWRGPTTTPQGRRLALLLALGLLLLLCLVPGARAEGGEEGGSASSSGLKGRADSPLWPATARDAAGLVCISIGLLIAAGGGIGGGGIIVALLILIQGLTPQQAIPISGVTVFGGAIANTISAATSRHPLAKGRPLIDFDVILLLEPPTVVGAVLGTFLNKLLPSVVVVVMLVIVLGAMGWRTMKKGLALLESEGGLRAMCRTHEDKPATTAPESPAVAMEMSAAVSGSRAEEGGAGPGGAAEASTEAAEEEEDEEAEPMDDMEIENLGPPMPTYIAKQSTLRAIFSESMRPWKWTLLSVWYVGVLLLTIFRGFVSRRSCGSLAYWLVVAAVLPWTGVFFWAIRRGILKEVQQKAAEGYQRLPGDVDWTPRRSLLYPLLCSIAGLFAGLFGVGGGIVKGPLMLEMGMLPPVVSACSSFMILMTTFASTLSFITFHMLKPDWALSYFAWGFLMTSIGDRTVKVLLRKYKKQSPIVLSIGIVVMLAALLMTGESIQKMVNDPGSVKRIGKICPRRA